MPASNMELVPVSQGPRESLFKRKRAIGRVCRMFSIAKSDLVKMGATWLSLEGPSLGIECNYKREGPGAPSLYDPPTNHKSHNPDTEGGFPRKLNQ